MKTLTLQRGFSTLEIVLAFSVGILFLSAALMIAFSDPTLTKRYSLDSGQAVGLDTILDNNGLATSTNRIGNIAASFLSNWTNTVAANTDGFYTNTPDVTDVSQCMKQFTNVTSWEALNARSRTITFGTALSNIDIARALGRGECDPTPPSPNEWDNPTNPNWETGPSEIDGTQTGLDVATIDGDPYAFLITSHTSQKDDLWSIDVSDVENPTLVSSLETGGVGFTQGLVDIDVVTTDTGTYAYVIQNSATNQLQTIDLSNPDALTPADIRSTISLATYGVVGGSDPIPKVIKHYNGRLYIGLHNTTGPELLIFSIASNPASPTYVGSITSSFNHSINDIVVNGNYAYLAIKPGTGGGAQATRELMIIDVSASTPVDTGFGYNANTTSNDTEGATSLYLIGSKLYMGRERVSNASERDFYVFNIQNPTSPTVIKSKRLGISTGGSMGTPRVIDMVIHGKVGFFATTDSTRPFQIFDVVSDANDITPINSSCDNYINLPKLTEIVYKDGLIYGANGNQAALNILKDEESMCTP